MLAIASVCWPFTDLFVVIVKTVVVLCWKSFIWSNHTFCADSVDNIFWGIRETMPVYVLLCFLVCTAQHTQCRDSTDWGHWGLVHLTQRWASRLQLLRRRVQHAIAHFQKFWLKSNWKQKNYTRGHSVHSHQCLYWQCLRNYRKCSNFLRQTNIKKKKPKFII